MGLWTLLEGCLLIVNALAILNEDRFLAPKGWSFQEYSGVRRNSMKGQIIGLVYATQCFNTTKNGSVEVIAYVNTLYEEMVVA